jgi:hypothetical protein
LRAEIQRTHEQDREDDVATPRGGHHRVTCPSIVSRKKTHGNPSTS